MAAAVMNKCFLQCVTCGTSYPADPNTLTCKTCGDYKGTLDVVYPYDEYTKPAGLNSSPKTSIFDYFKGILPVTDRTLFPPLVIGDTPLYHNESLNAHLGVSRTYIKDDTRNPSGSFKDRATAMAIAMARLADKNTIAVASTGNAAASTAALSAASGMRAVLFVPETAPPAKLTQLHVHGAEVLKFAATYDEVFDLCGQCCAEYGWYNRNTAVNPFTVEGKKTAALEIYLDLHCAPDNVILPVGDGCILSGTYKGFFDLTQLGWTSRMPRLFGVQAAGCAPIMRAFEEEKPVEQWGEITTSADSIAVGLPRDGVKAMRAVKETNGGFVAVSDRRIFKAQVELARLTGIYAEPSAAASYAGFKMLLEKGVIGKDEVSVILITGSGLKDIGFTSQRLKTDAKSLQPTLDAVAERIRL